MLFFLLNPKHKINFPLHNYLATWIKFFFFLFIANISGIFKSPFAETKTNEILHILDVHTQVQIHYSMISKIYFA